MFSDLASWQQWQHRRRGRLRSLRARVRGAASELPVFYWRGEKPAIVFAIDWLAPSSHHALVEPLRKLADSEVPVAVAGFGGLSRDALPGQGWESIRGRPANLLSRMRPEPAVLVSAGDYLPVAAEVAAALPTARHLVIQHGALTPYAPPLPSGCVLLSWSHEDGAFWTSGRSGIDSRVVGSQMLWFAAQGPRRCSEGDSLTFLGQLHGAELPRAVTVRTVSMLRGQAKLVYQAHPGERDLLSRLQHARWRRTGLLVRPGSGLRDVTGSVIGIFSTGILEAAAMGLTSFAVCEGPPPWIREFWTRYRVAVWGTGGQTVVELPDREPALACADAIMEFAQ